MTVAHEGFVHDEVKTRLLSLRRGGTVSGVCLMHEDFVLLNKMPFDQEVADRLAEGIHHMAEDYTSRGKAFSQACFSFNMCNLLVISHGKYLLGIVFTRMEDVDIVRGIAKLCFSDHPRGIF